MTARRTTHDVVVVGGGAIGSAAAWQLAGRGHEVTLLERFGPGHVEGASHGTSRIFRTSYPDATYVRLAQEAERGWRELEDESGTPLLTITGGVDHGDAATLDASATALTSLGVAFDRLTPEEAAVRWPGMRFETSALHHPGSGRVHADDSVTALQSGVRRRGGEVLHRVRVRSIEVRDDDEVVVRTDGADLHARRVVVAAGAWAADLVGALTPLPPVRVTEEQPAHFLPTTAADWPSFTHRLPATAAPFDVTYGLAGVEGVKVGFHGGGRPVHPDRRDHAIDAERLATLQRYVRHWLPGVDADHPAPISCTYATTPDENFVLDRVGPVVVAAGFSGHGFKFVPAVGRLLADLVDGRPAEPLFSLRPRTPAGASA